MKRGWPVLAIAAVVLATTCATATASSQTKLVKETCKQVKLLPGYKMLECTMTRPSSVQILVAYDPRPVYDIQLDFQCGGKSAKLEFQPKYINKPLAAQQLTVDARHNANIYRLLRKAASCQLFLTARAVHQIEPGFIAGIKYIQRPRSGATTA